MTFATPCIVLAGPNFGSGEKHSFGGTYLELVPGECIRYTDRFDDPNLPGDMQTTVQLRAVGCGTELNVTSRHIEDKPS